MSFSQRNPIHLYDTPVPFHSTLYKRNPSLLAEPLLDALPPPHGAIPLRHTGIKPEPYGHCLAVDERTHQPRRWIKGGQGRRDVQDLCDA